MNQRQFFSRFKSQPIHIFIIEIIGQQQRFFFLFFSCVFACQSDVSFVFYDRFKRQFILLVQIKRSEIWQIFFDFFIFDERSFQ